MTLGASKSVKFTARQPGEDGAQIRRDGDDLDPVTDMPVRSQRISIVIR